MQFKETRILAAAMKSEEEEEDEESDEDHDEAMSSAETSKKDGKDMNTALLASTDVLRAAHTRAIDAVGQHYYLVRSIYLK